jgi:hypothetical protein
MPTDNSDDTVPNARAVLRPESYPAKRRTEPMPESERSPGGKRHRDWTPDSKSPDVLPDGSLARNTEPESSSSVDERSYLRYVTAGITTLLLIAVALIYLL